MRYVWLTGALLVLAILLVSCSWPGGSPGEEYNHVPQTGVQGAVSITGPYPVGPALGNGLQASEPLKLGLFIVGSNQLAGCNGYKFFNCFSGVYQEHASDASFSYYGLEQRSFDLALFHGNLIDGDIINPQPVRVIDTIIPTTHGYDTELYSLDMEVAARHDYTLRGLEGAGEGSISGKLQFSGNPPLSGVRLIISPGVDPPDLSALDCSAWEIEYYPAHLGQSPINVPDVPFGDYSVCLDVPGQTGLWEQRRLAAQTISITADNPDITLEEPLVVRTTSEGRRPDGTGVISGSLSSQSSSEPLGLYTVVAEPIGTRNDVYALSAVWLAEPSETSGPWQADFTLGWLPDGEYRMAVYFKRDDFEPGNYPIRQDCFEPVVQIDVFNRVIEDVQLFLINH